MPGRRFLPVLMIFCMTISAAATQEKVEAAKVKVEVHLSAEHAPEAIKVKSRVDLVYVKSAIKTRTGKAKYMTAPLAKDAEVASIKREKNPADPAKAVRVELLVTKEQAAKGFRKIDMESAMRRLFDAGKIHVESYGRPSRPATRLKAGNRDSTP